jgi:predicted DNA-binding transcriptional regulator AlpA
VSKLLNNPPQDTLTFLSNPRAYSLPELALHGYVRREELAKQLGKSLRSIERLHASGQGPPRVQIGRTIFYQIRTVREWLRSREH